MTTNGVTRWLANTITQIQKYKFTRLLSDDWDDNQRGDSGSTPASSQEGWPHPSQHQPRHIGDQLQMANTNLSIFKNLFFNISLNRFEAIEKLSPSDFAIKVTVKPSVIKQLAPDGLTETFEEALKF